MNNLLNKLILFEEKLMLNLINITINHEKYGIIDKFSKYISSRKYQFIYFILISFITFRISDNYQTLLKLQLPFLKILFIRYTSYQIKLLFKLTRPFVNNPKLLINIKDLKKRKSFTFPSNSIVNTYSFFNIIINDILINIW